MELKINTKLDDLYSKYITVLSAGNGLSNKEQLILGELMKYAAKYPEDPTYALSPSIRKKICTAINISSYNLNNYISALKLKKALIQTDAGIIVNPVIMPIVKDKTCEVTFKFVIE